MEEQKKIENTIPLDNLADLDTKFAFDNSSEEVALDILGENIEEEAQALEIEKKVDEDKKPGKSKLKLVNKWKKLTKKKKVIFSLIFFGVILLIIITLFFLLQKKEDKKPDDVEDVAVIVKDNYKYSDGKLIFLNAEDKEIGTYECENKSEELCYVSYESNEDDFDQAINVDEEDNELLKRTIIYHDKYVFVSDHKKDANALAKLYNIDEQKVEDTYQLVKSSNNLENHVIVKNSTSLYALLKIEEKVIEEVIDYKFDYLGIIVKSGEVKSVVAREGVKNFLVDLTGKKITKVIPEDIKMFNDNLIVSATNGSYNIYDYEAKMIGETDYKHVSVNGTYIALVKKDNKLYIIDADGNKMLEDGFVLKNDNYVVKNVYDSKGVKLKSLFSYNFVINGNTFGIDIAEDEENSTYHVIEMSEGLVSKNYNYYSYFAGKLYFYNDLEKNSLIGIYTCENKNVLNEESKTFTSCFIASDDVSFIDNDMQEENISSRKTIPIYNSRFVFIADQPAVVIEENKKVVLYDLRDKKALANYSSVLTYEGSLTGEVEHKDSTATYVVAKNKSGNFGVIKITKTDVEGVLSFANQHIEKLGIYLLVKSNNKWYLTDYKANVVSAEFSGKIRGYNNNYLKVYEAGAYYIYYRSDGTKFDNSASVYNGAQYIELYNDFFAVVNSSKLYVFSYDKTEYLSSTSTNHVSLNSSKYYINGDSEKLAFTIKRTGSGVEVSVLNQEKTAYIIHNFSYSPGGES